MLKLTFTKAGYLLLATLCHHGYANTESPTTLDTKLDYKVLATAKHNPKSYTQGWIKEGDTFYESSGLYGRSFISRYSAYSQATLNISKQYFAEGLTLLGDTLYLLTWKKGKLLLIDKTSLEVQQEIDYEGEGWGLTHNNKQLIMSNGSSDLLFRHSKTFAIEKRLTIKGLKAINELEYVNGVVWANSWRDDHIYGIDSQTGCILKKLDLSPLRDQTIKPQRRNTSNVVNGIAFDAEQNGLWVTGKLWSKRYLIALPTIQKDKAHCNKPR